MPEKQTGIYINILAFGLFDLAFNVACGLNHLP